MGLRFRPTSQAELAYHADKLDLLILDLTDLPDHLLERAIPELCREKVFMPRAAEIIERCKALLAGQTNAGRADLGQMNALLDKNGHHHIRWIREGDHLRLVPADTKLWDESQRCTAADARRILREEGVTTPFLLEVLAAIERADHHPDSP